MTDSFTCLSLPIWTSNSCCAFFRASQLLRSKERVHVIVTCVVSVPPKIRDCKSTKVEPLVGKAKKIEVIIYVSKAPKLNA
jgi:hypothetical protein